MEAVELAQVRQRTSLKWRLYGPDVIPLWVAEMDYPLAEPIAATLHAAIDRSDTGYRWFADVPDALRDYLDATGHWRPDPESILVFGDVMSGIANVLRVVTQPSAGVVINPPVYHPFFSTIGEVAGRTVVEVPLLETDEGYELDFDGMAQAFARPDVTAYVMCNPHNPTGNVFSRSDLLRIAELAHEHDVFAIVDEIHAPLILGDRQHVSYVSLGVEAVGNAVSLISASKGWNIPGLKCAQLIASTPELAKTVEEALPMEATFGVGHLGVLASIAAFRDSRPWIDDVRVSLQAKSRLLAELLAEHAPSVGYRPPAASYLAWLDFRNTNIAADPTASLLVEADVALSAGEVFGKPGQGFARLNYAAHDSVLVEAVERIGRVVDGKV